MKTKVTFSEATDLMKAFKDVCDTVGGFNFPSVIQSNFMAAVEMHEQGKEQASEYAMDAVNGAQKVLSSFLRNSVLPGKIRNGETEPRKPFFVSVIDGFIAEGYDKDLIGSLKSKFKKLEEAVRTETNGTFTARIEAYNSLRNRANTVSQEQERREKKRDADRKNAEAAERKARQEAQAEASRKAAEAQRAEALARRKAEADKARLIFG